MLRIINQNNVVRQTLLYTNFQGVIPAKAGIQIRNTGFRIKSGMTIKGKGFMTHYTNNLDEFVKSCRSDENRSPKLFGFTGFPLSRE
jgi:hypothetical protein